MENTAVTLVDILKDFIQLLTGGITEMAKGLGSGVNTYVQELFLEVTESGEVKGLSLFGAVVAIFAGIALTIGITTLIFNWIKSMGN